MGTLDVESKIKRRAILTNIPNFKSTSTYFLSFTVWFTAVIHETRAVSFLSGIYYLGKGIILRVRNETLKYMYVLQRKDIRQMHDLHSQPLFLFHVQTHPSDKYPTVSSGRSANYQHLTYKQNYLHTYQYLCHLLLATSYILLYSNYTSRV